MADDPFPAQDPLSDSFFQTGRKEPDLQSAEKRFGDSFFQQARMDEALRNAKPSFLKDGFGLRGAPDPNIKRNTDFSQGAVIREPLRPTFPAAESTSAVTQVGGGQITPFFVTKGAGPTPGTTVLRVYPGKITSIVPTLGGTKLDATPRPTKLVTAIAPFSLFLRANISVDTDNLFRSLISAVKVSTDDDADVIPDIDGTTGEVPELKIFWENPGLTVGHFYVKVADLTVNGASEVTAIIQWLFDSYSTFVATASEAIIVI